MKTNHTKSEFKAFIEEYYSRCIDAMPSIEMVGAKWPFRSMIPDLSDFDGRIIADNSATPEAWMRLDEAIGDIHYNMVVKNPEWTRFLEHPVGICITWDEAYADDIYHPEMNHWYSFMGDHEKFEKFLAYLAVRPWDNRQEYYYLHKFLYYFSPYLHDIDPPINLGAWEKHYALHSRCMHYFVPAMQAAICLIKKKAVRCKFETLYGWKELLPETDLFDRILDMIEEKYDVPELYDQDSLLRFEDRLFEHLKIAMSLIKEHVTIIEMSDNADVSEYKKRLASIKINPLMLIFDGVRFSRVRKGRYNFYLREPKPFDSDILIGHEFSWLRNFFTRTVFNSYGELKCGVRNASLDMVIEAMKPDMIDEEGESIIRRVHEVSWSKIVPGKERDTLLKVAPYYREYYRILEAMLADARSIAASKCT